MGGKQRAGSSDLGTALCQRRSPSAATPAPSLTHTTRCSRSIWSRAERRPSTSTMQRSSSARVRSSSSSKVRPTGSPAAARTAATSSSKPHSSPGDKRLTSSLTTRGSVRLLGAGCATFRRAFCAPSRPTFRPSPEVECGEPQVRRSGWRSSASRRSRARCRRRSPRAASRPPTCCPRGR